MFRKKVNFQINFSKDAIATHRFYSMGKCTFDALIITEITSCKPKVFVIPSALEIRCKTNIPEKNGELTGFTFLTPKGMKTHRGN